MCSSGPAIQLRMTGRDIPWPRAISAMVSFSSATALSVVSDSPQAGRPQACSVPSFSSRATAASASPMVTDPGFHASAAASRSIFANTASRSDRCSTAQAMAASGGDCGGGSKRSAWRTAAASGAASLPIRRSLLEASWLRPIASAVSAAASNPSPSAWRCHISCSSARSTSRFAARVISAARWAARWFSAGVPRPRPSMAASISARRVEKASMTSRETPAISKRPSAWVFSMP